MQKSFKARLEALEALEAEAERGRQQIEDADIPDLAAMSDATVLWEAVLGMRRGNPGYSYSGVINLYPYGCTDPRWNSYVAALAGRAQPLIDACPRPFIALAGWEVEHALTLIDAGAGELVFESAPSRPDIYYWYRLGLVEAARDDGECVDTIHAVNFAVKLWSLQMLPDKGPTIPLETLEAWREWLDALRRAARTQVLDQVYADYD
jgi:hypothetical protein